MPGSDGSDGDGRRCRFGFRRFLGVHECRTIVPNRLDSVEQESRAIVPNRLGNVEQERRTLVPNRFSACISGCTRHVSHQVWPAGCHWGAVKIAPFALIRMFRGHHGRILAESSSLEFRPRTILRSRKWSGRWPFDACFGIVTQAYSLG